MFIKKINEMTGYLYKFDYSIESDDDGNENYLKLYYYCPKKLYYNSRICRSRCLVILDLNEKKAIIRNNMYEHCHKFDQV
jgi:hypothetical protein